MCAHTWGSLGRQEASCQKPLSYDIIDVCGIGFKCKIFPPHNQSRITLYAWRLNLLQNF